MTQIDYGRAAGYFQPKDFFARKATLNYPHEKGPLSLAWVVIVAFLAKFEVFGAFWARYAMGG